MVINSIKATINRSVTHKMLMQKRILSVWNQAIHQFNSILCLKENQIS